MNQMVTDVKADRQQGMMLLTHPDGITIFDTKQDTLYYIRRTDDIIKGMTQDGNGVYWVCTTSGSVVAIQPKRQADGNIQLSTFNYQLSSGMPQFYFNGDAMVCSPKGEILMGGTEGYMSIEPRRLMATKHEERDLVVSEIAVGDSLLNEQTTTVNLSHDAAHLTVKFFSGSLEDVQRIRYAYRLVGLMSGWTMTDHNYVSFDALSPGDYTLQLSICREDGTMSTPRELRISVAPPFYRTLPMYILYAVIVLGSPVSAMAQHAQTTTGASGTAAPTDGATEDGTDYGDETAVLHQYQPRPAHAVDTHHIAAGTNHEKADGW